jgi:hypothetical protein
MEMGLVFSSKTDPLSGKFVGWLVERKSSEKVRSVWG